MPRAISPIETPSDWDRRIKVLITPGESFVRVPSAAMRSTCSPSKATRAQALERVLGQSHASRLSHRQNYLTTPYI